MEASLATKKDEAAVRSAVEDERKRFGDENAQLIKAQQAAERM
jgi:hypothetical protein